MSFFKMNKDAKIIELEAEIARLKRENESYQIMRRSEVEFIDKLKHKLVLSELKCLEIEREVLELKEKLSHVHENVAKIIFNKTTDDETLDGQAEPEPAESPLQESQTNQIHTSKIEASEV